MWTIEVGRARVDASVTTRLRPDEGEPLNIRTRLTMTTAALLVGAAASACGGGSGAPSDASEKDFCQTQASLLEDLLPDDMTNPEVPSGKEMAEAVKGWGEKLEAVGTPEDIPEDARKGFEAVVKQADEINADDFSIEKLEELEQGGKDASAETKKQATAFSDYLTEKCGNPMDNIELPEMPEMPELPESTE